MAEAAATPTDGDSIPTPPPPNPEEDSNSGAAFECNICLDTAKDAVVSYCGHLFWYVIYVHV